MTTPAINGSIDVPRPRRRTEPKAAKAEKPETYHGIPVLALRVDDPIPTPAVPTRYAVRVYPDLARYLLTFNHPDNRARRGHYILKYASDMAEGLWRLTPQGPVFGRSGVLQNGQNTLRAVEESGATVWLVLDFGWPDDVIYVIDRGAARTLADSLKIDGVASSRTMASAVTKWWQYTRLVGTRRSIQGYPSPSHEHSRELINASPDVWAEAARRGTHVYDRLDRAWGASYWAAGFAVIVSSGAGQEMAAAFYEEVAEGTGKPRSATRDLADWVRRRPAFDTKTGDKREPLELIVRAFNAWRAGRSLAKPKQPGFEWSRIRP